MIKNSLIKQLTLAIMLFSWVGQSTAQNIDTLSTEVVSDDIASEDRFGTSVALYRDTLVVGAPFEDQGGQNAGAAYVFERNQGGSNGWGQTKKITASDASASLRFGLNIAISGDTLVAADQFSTYIFGRNVGGPDNWGETKKLNFAGSLALWADTLVVSGVGGATHILERNQGGANQWGEAKTLLDSPVSPNAVSIAADTIVLAYDSLEAVEVYERDQGGAGQWGKVKTITPEVTAVGRKFGASLAILDDTLVIGALGSAIIQPTDHMPPDNILPGAFHVYERDHTGVDQWGRTKMYQDDLQNIWFGARVAIWKDIIIVRGLLNAEVSVHARNQFGPNGWGEIKRFDIVDSRNIRSSDHIAIVDDTVVIGSSIEDFSRLTQSGAAYVFTVSGTVTSEDTCFPVKSKNSGVSIICL